MNTQNNSLGENTTQKLVKKLQENRTSLHIARVPKKTRELFIAIADEEFCSDYGFFLKFLLDKVIGQDNKIVMEKLEEQDKRIQQLENNSKESDIKLLNGKSLKGGKI